MEIGDRVKLLRKELKITQTHFGEKIGLAQSYQAQVESGTREVTERIVKTICAVFNVNETWLRDGVGEMFNTSEGMTFEEYAKKKGLDETDLEIIQAFMEMDPQLRKGVVEHFRSFFGKRREKTEQEKINEEVESYRAELEAAARAKGETSIRQKSSAFDKLSGA